MKLLIAACVVLCVGVVYGQVELEAKPIPFPWPRPRKSNRVFAKQIAC